MTNKKHFKLNLQLFADETGATPPTPPSGTGDGGAGSNQATLDNNTGTATVTNPPEVNHTEPTGNLEKTFTQSQVNDIISKRLNRHYMRYGVKDRNELDTMINKARSYDIMKEKYDSMSAENGSLNEKIAFMNNNINPDRYDDIRAFFKGSNTLFNEGNLVEALKTHPEWINAQKGNSGPQTTIKVLGSASSPRQPDNEKKIASRIFGVEL